MAKRTPITLFLGDDRQPRIRILTEDETAAVDITGWALSFKVKRYASDADSRALIEKSTAAGSIVISGSFHANPVTSTQVAVVTIDDTDTDPLEAGTGVFELKRTDAGLETVLAYGPVTFIRSVHGA